MTSTNNKYWYAIQVRSAQERRIADQLAKDGIHVFLPEQKVRKKWSDRVKIQSVALFSGYFFAKVDLTSRFRIERFRGIKGFVDMGGAPARIPEEEISALQILVSSQRELSVHPFVTVGRSVRILSGPFKDAQGVLVRAKNGNRLVVSVSILNRSVAIELDHDIVIESDLQPTDGERSVTPGREILIA